MVNERYNRLVTFLVFSTCDDVFSRVSTFICLFVFDNILIFERIYVSFLYLIDVHHS